MTAKEKNREELLTEASGTEAFSQEVVRRFARAERFPLLLDAATCDRSTATSVMSGFRETLLA